MARDKQTQATPPPIHRMVESTKKIKRGVDAEVQMRHSCVKGGGKRQLGSFGASFSRVRAICSRGRLRLISENLAKNRSFCGTEQFLAS